MPFVVDDILIGLPSSFSSGLKSALQSLSVRSSYLFVSRRANERPRFRSMVPPFDTYP